MLIVKDKYGKRLQILVVILTLALTQTNTTNTRCTDSGTLPNHGINNLQRLFCFPFPD